ncbi:DapH/DapD/GlmU-related protein [Neolewinella antarctica]|uniref:UDP-3-O-[3-hydroxymyristoyl] glucosamine N-acyltransferase n=1 Tax=Neolewinella antarctica TaxID=442734 RepID=A0ABX0XDA6_9BACT|nr:DapH/DapD/GlmU-related protein [Neolewinella antarctica]NJC27241.1 UDP-3-O-[3-hydroxymyristoyl] glucosamine N-acyltransferase [Neolewinella antarctica]
MRLSQPILAADLAARLGAELIGDGTVEITGLNEIHHVEAGDACFVDHPRYYAKTLASAASVVLIDKAAVCPPGKALIVTPNPFGAYNDLVGNERSATNWTGFVDRSASIGAFTRFGPGAVAGAGVVVGEHCYIGPNAVLCEGVRLGDNVYVGAGAVIGEEAFYFKKVQEGYRSWRSGGTVIIEDHVVIGANCNISRGVSSPTVIGEGTKIDALVQIGHDCKIGKHCLLAAQVGIAGNTTLGDWCVLLGQAGIAQNLTLADKTVILAQSGLGDDTEIGKSYFGSPAQESRVAFRDLLALRKLKDL